MVKTDKYDRLCELMEASNGRECFEDLCKKAGVSIVKADNYLYGVYGMSGNELLSKMFNDGILPSC